MASKSALSLVLTPPSTAPDTWKRWNGAASVQLDAKALSPLIKRLLREALSDD